MEALEQSNNFVCRLITEEAKDESCELSRYQRINSPSAWEQFTALVPGEKIGMTVINGEQFSPLYSSGAVIYWVPLKKSRGSK